MIRPIARLFLLLLIVTIFELLYAKSSCKTGFHLSDPPIAGSFQFPTSPYVVTGYQFAQPVIARGGVRHLGEDIGLTPETEVRAVADGNVIWACTGVSGFAQVVVMEHKLSDGTFMTSIYGHLSRRPSLPYASPGFISKGTIVGYIGYADENGEDGSHLHFGIRKGKHPGSTWVYYGRAGAGQDVDVDMSGNVIGGAFTNPTTFINGRLVSPTSAFVDFSIAKNPNGVWSYGYSDSLRGAFNFHTTAQPDFLSGVDRWTTPAIGDYYFMIAKNRTGLPLFAGTFDYPADMLYLHPTLPNRYNIVRWTAPTSGIFTFEGKFAGLDRVTSVADTDVHILRDSATDLLPTTVLHGVGTEQPFSFSLTLGAGETMDFAVGKGPSGFHQNDSTGLKVVVTPASPL